MKLKFFISAILCGVLTLLIPQAAFAEEVVPITSNGMAVDSFQGIHANYIMGTGNSNTGDYCCAGYVIKFYKELYGVDTYNINTVWGMPTVVKQGHDVWLEEVSEPKPGDMMQSLTYSHVGIVKEVTDNNTAILIEQNYKWSQNGQTVATVEREIGFNEAHFYRLYIDGEAKVFEEETPQPTGIAAVNQMPSITGADISLLEDAIIRGQGNE